MQMQQVRYFLALCEELNFTRAARCCGISQPSLTTAIRKQRSTIFSTVPPSGRWCVLGASA